MKTKKIIPSRERFLEVLRILQEHTDERNQLDIHEIQGHFSNKFKVGLRGIREDLQVLEGSTVFPVIATQEKNGLKKKYYYDGRLFEVHELRLLMDAIVAAKFIPKQETEGLLMKIRRLTSDNFANQLKNELQVAEQMNHNTQEVSKFVQLLHEAIENKQIVTFQYGRYNTELQFRLGNEGNEYEVKPLGLVWNKDRYYLVANYIPKDEVRQYRVDRMRNVQLMEASFVPEPTFNLRQYVNNMMHMYSGEMISLEAEFSEKLINVVIDRFGLKANIQSDGNRKFVLKTMIAKSDGLIGWLLRWGSDVKVLHPPKLVHEMKEEIQKLAQQYE